MKPLRSLLDKLHHSFSKGSKLEQLYPLYEMVDTILFSPSDRSRSASHIRDGIDLKRIMLTVIAALTPVLIFSLYNNGYQANLSISNNIAQPLGWRGSILELIGISNDPTNVLSNFIHGILLFLPIFLVVQAVGGFWEILFSVVRKHEVNEGFLVTGMLIPLIVPASIPLDQLAIGTSFGIVVGKEIFGGTGMNVLNPALTARAFLFFAYPSSISGDKVWTGADSFSGATPLGKLAASGDLSSIDLINQTLTFPMYANDIFNELTPWMRNFIGFNQGSFGDSSVLFALVGALILIISGIGSWRIMLSSLAGMVVTSLFFNLVASPESNPMFYITPLWHLVIGGFAFGIVFMATDPVSATMTESGKWIYGFLIGLLTVLIRVVNPAYPEGVMLAILFMNLFSPAIDHVFVTRNIKRRKLRNV